MSPAQKILTTLIAIPSIPAAILAGLRLAGVIPSCPWLWILSPLWIAAILYVVVFTVLGWITNN